MFRQVENSTADPAVMGYTQRLSPKVWLRVCGVVTEPVVTRSALRVKAALRGVCVSDIQEQKQLACLWCTLKRGAM